MDVAFKQSLKSQAHHLKPVILLGAKGLTEAVIAEANIALECHELIKIKLTGVEKAEKSEKVEELCEKLHADLIQLIGNTATVYRKKQKADSPVKKTQAKRSRK